MKTLKRIIFSVLFSLFIVTSTFSQTETSWTGGIDRDILDKVMNIEYSQPAGFVGSGGLTSIFYNDGTLGDNVRINLISEDQSCIVGYRIFNPLTKEDSVKFFPNAKGNVVDMGHWQVEYLENRIKRAFKNDTDWKKHVYYYPLHDVTNRFNADTVFSVSFMLDKNKTKYYDNNYSNCTILIIQKKGRGYVAVYCVYDERAEKKMNSYMAAIEGSIKYREGEPELTRIEGGDAFVIIEWSGPKADKVR